MSNPNSAGFSFIEVLVAMVILSISLVVLMGSQTRSMDLVGRARSLDYATTLATTKMTELIQEVDRKGLVALREEEAGEFDQERYPGYRWQYQLKEVPPPNFAAMMGSMTGQGENEAASNAGALAGPLKSIEKVWGDALRELHVEVLWGEGKRVRSVELVTHLFSPNAIGQLEAAISSLGGGTTE